MLTNIENRLEELFEQIEMMPTEKVEAAEKVSSHNSEKGGQQWHWDHINTIKHDMSTSQGALVKPCTGVKHADKAC